MLIRVRYLNGKYDFVKPALLDYFIDEMRVVQFRRSCGWVHVFRDPVRRGRGLDYAGEEKRAGIHAEGERALSQNRSFRSESERTGDETGRRVVGFFIALVFFLLLIAPMSVLLIGI